MYPDAVDNIVKHVTSRVLSAQKMSVTKIKTRDMGTYVVTGEQTSNNET